MENSPSNELTDLLSQLQYLQTRIKELETENAKLSIKLTSCVCQKSVGSDEAQGLECSQSVGEMKSLKLESNGVNTKNFPGSGGHARSVHHLPKRYIALKVMYFGQRFYGFASEAQMEPTVESEIFKALKKTMLISGDKKELKYARCGRTDKGVSSIGQVISLFVRSKLKERAADDGYSEEPLAEKSCGEELDYVKILNGVLPKDIRIIGWSSASSDFSARFSCLSREYKYLFWRGNLDIMAMEVASKKFIGEHDFRNFCKMDAANVHNYRRRITSFQIIQCIERFEGDQLWAVNVTGSAFLWHQIRCMVAVLFLIGQGLESPDVVDVLLDIELTPRKPQYTMAPEIPLVLQSCEFEELKFMCSSDARKALYAHLEKECRDYKLQSAIFNEALLNSSSDIYDYNQLNNRTKKKEPAHIPLLSRPTEPSYEERSSKLKAGGRANKLESVAAEC